MIARKTILWTFLTLVVITSLTPFISWMKRPSGSSYSGITLESGIDFPFYLNLIEQSERGNVLFKNFMVPNPHDGVLFHPLFLAVGRFVAATGIAAIPSWHIFRLLLILPFLFILRGFLRVVVHDPADRQFAFFAVLFGGVVYSHYYETSVFLLMYHSPLSILSILTTTAWFWLFLLAWQTGWNRKRVALLFALGIFQAVSHPYILLLWAAVPFAMSFVAFLQTRKTLFHIVRLLLPIAALLVLAGTYLFVLLQNPVLREWSLAAANHPWPLSQMFTYGIVLLPLAAIGAFRRKKSMNPHGYFLLLIWLLAALVLSRANSYPYAGRVMIAFYLPLGVFAGIGFRWLFGYARQKPQWFLVVAFVLIISFFDHGIRLVRGVIDWHTDVLVNWRYIDRDAKQAFQWIRNETPETAVLMHAPRWETLIAQQTYRQVYCTYGGYTPRYHERWQKCLFAYAGKYDADGFRTLLQNNFITHVLVGPLERESGQYEQHITGNALYRLYTFAFDPESYPYLEKVYDAGGWKIYEAHL